jgi:hypothetical protein
MRPFGTALWCAVLAVALPGCFATLRAGYPLGGPGDEYKAPYNFEIIAGLNVEVANTLRFAGGASTYGSKGDFKGKNAGGQTDSGTLEIAAQSRYAELDLTLKNW